MEVSFTECRLTAEDRKQLGDDLTAVFLTMAFYAEEIMQLQHLLIMSLRRPTADSIFVKSSSGRSNFLIRTLNLKLYEFRHAMRTFSTTLERRQTRISAELAKVLKRLDAYESKVKSSSYNSLSKQIRDKLSGHLVPQVVKAWLPHIPENAEDRFLFHATKANSNFSCTDDLVFAACLNEHWGNDEINDEKYNAFLDWVVSSANDAVTEFHHAAIIVFIEFLGKDISKDVKYNIDNTYVGRNSENNLPVFFLNK